jgi:hypothetical protein
MRRLPLVALLLLLAGCAGEEAHWTKPGNSAEQAAADYRTCNAKARADVNQSLGPESSRLDLMTAPPTLSGTSTNMVQDMQRANLAAEGRRRADAETASCMRGKGYLPR